MNETTGFPAPALPPPGGAPHDFPAPAATQPLTAPSLPEPGIPTLPPSGTPAPSTSATSETDHSAEATTAAPESAERRSSSVGRILPLLLIVGAGALGYLGFTSMSDDGTDDVAEPTPATIAPDATSPLLVPILDAEDVVDQVNDNAAENELLGELGLLDASAGTTIQFHTADVIENDLVSVVGAPTFQYKFQRGTALEQSVWVDSTSGDRELFDGVSYVRVVDGVAYSSATRVDAWSVDPGFAPTDPLATLTEMVTLDRVLPEEVLDAASSASVHDESGSGRYVFVDAELAATAGAGRDAWLGSWGFDATIAPTSVDGPTIDLADTAQPGVIIVAVVSSADGIVTSLTIEAPGIGESVRYRLVGASPEPIDFGAPGATTG